MKILVTTFFAVFVLNVSFGQSPTDDLNIGLIEMRDGGGRALRELDNLPPDKQLQVFKSIIKKLQIISKEQGPMTADTVSFVSSAAWLLGEIGTDEQIITAFGNLSGFRNAESDAALGLAFCESPAGVEIMENLAYKRLPNLEPAITPTTAEDKKQFDDTFIPFYNLILRLDGARNSAGQRAALRLRNEFATQYPSDKGKFFLAELDKELAGKKSLRTSLSKAQKKEQPRRRIPPQDPDPLSISLSPRLEKTNAEVTPQSLTQFLIKRFLLPAVMILAATGTFYLIIKKRGQERL
jgi:hypothetical protein